MAFMACRGGVVEVWSAFLKPPAAGRFAVGPGRAQRSGTAEKVIAGGINVGWRLPHGPIQRLDLIRLAMGNGLMISERISTLQLDSSRQPFFFFLSLWKYPPSWKRRGRQRVNPRRGCVLVFANSRCVPIRVPRPTLPKHLQITGSWRLARRRVDRPSRERVSLSSLHSYSRAVCVIAPGLVFHGLAAMDSAAVKRLHTSAMLLLIGLSTAALISREVGIPNTVRRHHAKKVRFAPHLSPYFM